MNRRSEFLIGFAAAVLAGAGLRDWLQKIHLPLGFAVLNGEQYFIGLAVVFAVCLWLIAVEYVLEKKPGLGHWASYAQRVIDVLMLFVVASPPVLLLLAAVYQIVALASNFSPATTNLILSIIASVAGIIIGNISWRIARKLENEKTEVRTEVLSREQAVGLEVAERMVADGYSSAAILETFKVLERHILELLLRRGIRTQSRNFVELLKVAGNEKLLSAHDVAVIENLRKMRNAVAHQFTNYTIEDARETIRIVRHLLIRDVGI